MDEPFAAMELKTYPERWQNLLLCCLLQSLWAYGTLDLHQSTRTIELVFELGGYEIFWLEDVVAFAFAAIMPVLAWLAASKTLRLRGTITLAAAFQVAAFFALSLAMGNRQLASVTYVGQAMLGVSGALLFATQALITYAWFSDAQVGISMGAQHAGFWLGAALGSSVPRLYLESLFPADCSDCDEALAARTNSYKLLDSRVALLSVSFLSMAAGVFLCADLPPSPPSRVQLRRRIEHASAASTDCCTRTGLCDCFAGLYALCKDKSFLLWILFLSLHAQTVGIELLLMAGIFRSERSRFGAEMDPVRTGGLLTTLYCLGAMLGSYVCGLVMDCVRRYLLLARLACVGSFMASVFVFVTFFYVNVPGMCAANFALGLFAGAALLVGGDALAQLAYPASEDYVVCVTLSLLGLIVAPITLLDRLVLRKYGGDKTLGVALCGGLLLALITSAFVSTKYKRHKAEETLRSGLVRIPSNDSEESRTLLDSGS